MKKLLVLFMVLGMCTGANAALTFTVNGEEPVLPIELYESDTIEIDIEGDGVDENPTPYLVVIGPGSINGGHILYDPTSGLIDYKDAEKLCSDTNTNAYFYPLTVEDALAFIARPIDHPDGGWGIPGTTDFSLAEIISDKTSNIPLTTGTLVDSIIFHCEGTGPVLIRMIYWDENGELQDYDTLEISQIPEPITIGLLGLGALFLRRRK